MTTTATPPITRPCACWARIDPITHFGHCCFGLEAPEDCLYSRACCIVGHCDQGAHDCCWQADDVPPPDHALDACDKAHELRCRCDCHERSAADDGLLFL